MGPILFTEETSFRKEIHLGENITVNILLAGTSSKNERLKLRHEVFNEAGELSAVIKVYGAWMDLTKRKLTALPEQANHLFLNAEKTADFEEIPINSKS